MRSLLFLTALALVGCGKLGSTAKLPADLDARLTSEGVVRRGDDLMFRYTEAPGSSRSRWEDRRASIVVTPATILIHKNAKIGLEITPRTRRAVAIERDGRRIRVRAGSGRAEELWSFEPPDGDVEGWTRDLRVVAQAARSSTSGESLMDPRVSPLALLYQLNTDLLLHCLEGLSDSEAQTRLAAGGNSITFLAGHLADSRHFLVDRLGRPLPNPLAGYFAEVRSIEEVREWPSLSELRAAWLGVSAHLNTVLDGLGAAELDEPDAHRFPVHDPSRLGMITFLVQHDSYHLGQVAFLRRQLGKPAMSYRRAPASAS